MITDRNVNRTVNGHQIMFTFTEREIREFVIEILVVDTVDLVDLNHFCPLLSEESLASSL